MVKDPGVPEAIVSSYDLVIFFVVIARMKAICSV
jgi:hypothetical protein